MNVYMLLWILCFGSAFTFLFFKPGTFLYLPQWKRIAWSLGLVIVLFLLGALARGYI